MKKVELESCPKVKSIFFTYDSSEKVSYPFFSLPPPLTPFHCGLWCYLNVIMKTSEYTNTNKKHVASS